MNVFMIHSGVDKEKAKEIKDSIKKMLSDDVNVSLIEYNPAKWDPFWKWKARKLIKQAQLILFLVGEESHKSKNIQWEIKIAKKY